MIKKTAVWLLLGLALLAAPFGAAYGAQDTAQVTGYTGNMVMGADGSLAIEEYVTWRVSGSPRLSRRLDVSNATSVENISVYRVTDPDPAQPEDAQRVALESGGTAASDTYDAEITEDGSGRYLSFTLRPEIGERYLTLVFSYRLTDCAYLYQDGAAFYFNPLWQAGEGTLDSFYMHCRLGENIEQGEGTPHYYANGGITEEWTGPDLFSSEVDLNTGLEVVAVLPVDWVPQGRKTVKNNILPHLDAQQQIYQVQRQERYAQRQNALARGRLTLWVAVAVMAGGVLLIFLLYGVRPSRRSQQKKYMPPSRHLPGEVRLLLRRSLSRRTALAELIYLWHLGFVKLVQGEGKQWTLKQEKRSDEELSLHDQYLLSVLVHHSGGKDSIRDKLSDPTAFRIWKGLVKKTVAQKGILKEAKAAWVIGLGLGVMEWVLAAMIVVNVHTWDTAIVVAMMGVLVAGYGCVVRKVSPEEVREIARYRFYARQLRREKGCAGPWKRQLAYAMALGADRPLLRILIKEGKGEVRDFAVWVRRERWRMTLPVWILSISAGDGHKKMKPVKTVDTARHEAAATRIEEHGKRTKTRDQKPVQTRKTKPRKPVVTPRQAVADTRIEEYGKRIEAKYRKPDQTRKPKPLKPISSARHESAAARARKRGKHARTKYRKPDPKQWPPGGRGKR